MYKIFLFYNVWIIFIPFFYFGFISAYFLIHRYNQLIKTLYFHLHIRINLSNLDIKIKRKQIFNFTKNETLIKYEYVSPSPNSNIFISRIFRVYVCILTFQTNISTSLIKSQYISRIIRRVI